MRNRFLAVLLTMLLISNAMTLNASPVLKKETVQSWNTYISLTEKRIDSELKSTPVSLRSDIGLLKSGTVQVKRLETPDERGKEFEIPEGAAHHWLGAIFVPGVRLDQLLPWLQNYAQHSEYFKDVERSSGTRGNQPDTFDVFLRLTRSKLGVTAHFNTKHHIVYQPRSSGFASSVSRSTEIRQIRDAGTPQEKEYPEGEDSGYLWRLNSYWRFIERDGGVVVECETVGLSRPLGWGLSFLNILMLGKVKSIAESVAREALEQTLTDLRNGVRGGPRKPKP
jgi:hypothetical protein